MRSQFTRTWYILPVMNRRGLIVPASAVLLAVAFGVHVLLGSSERTARDEVLGQMRKRPGDPWPRGTGHVLLAFPGSKEEEKGYHEPGGSFSPVVGSFGLSLWIVDDVGRLVTTSDAVPIDSLEQAFVWSEDSPLPEIHTRTPHYEAAWRLERPGSWNLRVRNVSPRYHAVAVVRSVGPAGGSISALDWDGQRLLVNDRWTVEISPGVASVYVGEEGQRGWLQAREGVYRWSGPSGWGFARIAPGGADEWNLVIQDPAPSYLPNLRRTRSARSNLTLHLPDPRFAASLDAQVAHLLMSLVNGQTRPGDPVNYPLAWQRDGAYILTALARAGHLDAAREVSDFFAEHDFFGGFGPEADAPGLSIWALEEVAVRLRDPDHDLRLWPHVYRKAELILEMLHTRESIHRPVFGAVVPAHRTRADLTLVAEAARDGLIVGRMDFQRPLLYVNSVSYLGLLRAAELAERLGKQAEAGRWRSAATALQSAWQRALSPPETHNERTFATGLWPTWVAAPSREAYREELQRYWDWKRDPDGRFRERPLWTYFDIAESHQWLFLGSEQHVWRVLGWFWEHQASPGLFTWWEGQGEVNAFPGWSQVRGWVRPPHVTPHYWTAAEMLLLQLDMLGYLDQATHDPVLVIGGGIPPEWIAHPMKVEGLTTPHGTVSWAWDTRQMRVEVRGEATPVRLGPAFPADAPVLIRRIPLQDSGASARAPR
jgi:hypothetical protein